MTYEEIVRNECALIAKHINGGAKIEVAQDSVTFLPSEPARIMLVNAPIIASIWEIQRYIDPKDKIIIKSGEFRIFRSGKVEDVVV